MDITPPKRSKIPFSKRYADELKPAEAAAAKPEPEKSGGGWKSVFSTVLLFTLAPLIAFGIAAFGLQSYEVDGHSMETTLQNQDRLIVNKVPRTWSRITHHAYIPKRGDIIVFNEPGLFDSNGLAEKQLIKRVIGLPGDRVVVSNGHYTVYNAQHPDGFNPDTAAGYRVNVQTFPTGPYSDVTLKAGQVFVSGDNRPNSEDSRAFGPIDANQIVGQLVLRLIPLKNAERF